MASGDIYANGFDEDVAQNDHNTCPECNGRVTTNAHETVCDECGLILEDERIDHGPEWREFEGDSETKRRTGSPNTAARHDRGIGSEIGRRRDGSGRQLKHRKQRHIGRLRREHKRAKTGSKAERNRMEGFIEIRRMTSALGVSDSLRDQACQLFRTAQNDDLLRGRSIEAIASGCVYAVCRLNEQPRTFTDIAAVSKVAEDRIQHGYRVLNRELDLPAPPASPTQYLRQIASAVNASRETERRARALLDRADDQRIANGHNPAGAAAGALYLAAQQTGELLTQAAIADAADVSTVTVRERYRDLDAAEVA